jgi:hypothetical protein
VCLSKASTWIVSLSMASTWIVSLSKASTWIVNTLCRGLLVFIDLRLYMIVNLG